MAVTHSLPVCFVTIWILDHLEAGLRVRVAEGGAGVAGAGPLWLTALWVGVPWCFVGGYACPSWTHWRCPCLPWAWRQHGRRSPSSSRSSAPERARLLGGGFLMCLTSGALEEGQGLGSSFGPSGRCFVNCPTGQGDVDESTAGR